MRKGVKEPKRCKKLFVEKEKLYFIHKNKKIYI